MSTPYSKPFPFTASIGAIAASDSSAGPKCPRHMHLPFDAVYYRTGDGSEGSPYVGTVDIEGYYSSLAFTNPEDGSEMPSFPGYRIPPKGQVQIVIKNGTSTALKVFLIPYDLEEMPAATKTFLRQKSYSKVAPQGRESLKYAAQLHFCCPPVRPGKKRKFYLDKYVRLAFANRAADADEKLRVVVEGPSGTAERAADAVGAGWAPYAGPGEEWWELLDKNNHHRRRRSSIMMREDRDGDGAGRVLTAGDSMMDPRPHQHHHDWPYFPDGGDGGEGLEQQLPRSSPMMPFDPDAARNGEDDLVERYGRQQIGSSVAASGDLVAYSGDGDLTPAPSSFSSQFTVAATKTSVASPLPSLTFHRQPSPAPLSPPPTQLRNVVGVSADSGLSRTSSNSSSHTTTTVNWMEGIR
jgi:hypothetical protein